jgi:hypothetical protein
MLADHCLLGTDPPEPHFFAMQNQHQSQGAPANTELSHQGKAAVAAIAERHHVSPEAVAVLLGAIARGHGQQAQFSHPDLGGMGQWSRGGMLMIGDMFNHNLKAKVAALCEDVASLLGEGGTERAGEQEPSLFAQSNPQASPEQWPSELGRAASSGSQNDMRYAVFPETHRLAIARGDKLTIYDTGNHQISGFGQQQGSTGSLTLTSQHGVIRLDDLPVVSGAGSPENARDAARSPADAAPSTPSPADEASIFAKIEGLADLHSKGLLTDDEYQAKKSELLSRL